MGYSTRNPMSECLSWHTGPCCPAACRTLTPHFTASSAPSIDSSDHCFCFWVFLGPRAGTDLEHGLPLCFPRLGISDMISSSIKCKIVEVITSNLFKQQSVKWIPQSSIHVQMIAMSRAPPSKMVSLSVKTKIQVTYTTAILSLSSYFVNNTTIVTVLLFTQYWQLVMCPNCATAVSPMLSRRYFEFLFRFLEITCSAWTSTHAPMHTKHHAQQQNEVLNEYQGSKCTSSSKLSNYRLNK